MPQHFLYEYYSRNNCNNLNKIFINNVKENDCKIKDVPKDCIILHGDEIEKCISNILDNSADRIIVLPDSTNILHLNIFIWELSKCKRNSDIIKNKIEHTGNHIADVLKSSKFIIDNIKCCYIGQYEDLYKVVMKKKSPIVKISAIKKYNISVNRFNSGVSFKNLLKPLN